MDSATLSSHESPDTIVNKKEHDPDKAKEIDELMNKVDDLQAELDLPQQEFEDRLMKRLKDEIKINRQQLEIDLKQELAAEKKKLLVVTNEEKT